MFSVLLLSSKHIFFTIVLYVCSVRMKYKDSEWPHNQSKKVSQPLNFAIELQLTLLRCLSKNEHGSLYVVCAKYRWFNFSDVSDFTMVIFFFLFFLDPLWNLTTTLHHLSLSCHNVYIESHKDTDVHVGLFKKKKILLLPSKSLDSCGAPLKTQLSQLLQSICGHNHLYSLCGNHCKTVPVTENFTLVFVCLYAMTLLDLGY